MAEGVDRGVRGVRIGVDEHYITHDVDPELAEAVLGGVRALEHQGAEVVEVHMPEMEPFLSAWPVLCSAEAVAAHQATYPSRREEYGPWFRDWLDLGAGVTGAAYARANNQRAACNGLLRQIFGPIDVLACPAMPTPPFRVAGSGLSGPLDDGLDMSLLRFTAPSDFNGAPTISVPCGLNSEGLPLSLQLVGKHLEEKLLCRIGHAYEQATEWHAVHPPA
jgi:amidase